MKTRITILLAIGASVFVGGGRIGASPFGVMMPTGSSGGDGAAFALEPLNSLATTSIRYQQVYLPWAFEGVGDGASAFWIEAVAFRLDATYGATFSTGLDIQVNLPTTTRGPDGLSTLFADNVGADDTVVYPRGELALSAAYYPDLSPQSDPIAIIFSQPFYYDTRAGNLLLDVRYFGVGAFAETAILDAFNVPNDDTSRVWANSVNATSGTADSLGLVFGFYVTPIPEPSTVTLLFCGTAVIGFVVRRQTHRAK